MILYIQYYQWPQTDLDIIILSNHGQKVSWRTPERNHHVGQTKWRLGACPSPALKSPTSAIAPANTTTTTNTAFCA